MIDTTISMGNVLTAVTIAGTLFFTTGTYSTRIDTVENEQAKTIKKIENNSNSIVHLKVGQAKIETKIDERFNKLEELIMDLEK
jgi:hypothetical protein